MRPDALDQPRQPRLVARSTLISSGSCGPRATRSSTRRRSRRIGKDLLTGRRGRSLHRQQPACCAPASPLGARARRPRAWAAIREARARDVAKVVSERESAEGSVAGERHAQDRARAGVTGASMRSIGLRPRACLEARRRSSSCVASRAGAGPRLERGEGAVAVGDRALESRQRIARLALFAFLASNSCCSESMRTKRLQVLPPGRALPASRANEPREEGARQALTCLARHAAMRLATSSASPSSSACAASVRRARRPGGFRWVCFFHGLLRRKYCSNTGPRREASCRARRPARLAGADLRRDRLFPVRDDAAPRCPSGIPCAHGIPASAGRALRCEGSAGASAAAACR